jgi:hypothetical protein
VFVIDDELRKFYSESVCDFLDRVGLHLALSVGQWPSDAVQRLVDALAGSQLDTDRIVTIDDAARDGHLEFLIPYRNRWRLPDVSLN